MLEQLTDEFIAIYDRSPARLKNKLTAIKELTSCSRAVSNCMQRKQYRFAYS